MSEENREHSNQSSGNPGQQQPYYYNNQPQQAPGQQPPSYDQQQPQHGHQQSHPGSSGIEMAHASKDSADVQVISPYLILDNWIYWLGLLFLAVGALVACLDIIQWGITKNSVVGLIMSAGALGYCYVSTVYARTINDGMAMRLAVVGILYPIICSIILSTLFGFGFGVGVTATTFILGILFGVKVHKLRGRLF